MTPGVSFAAGRFYAYFGVMGFTMQALEPEFYTSAYCYGQNKNSLIMKCRVSQPTQQNQGGISKGEKHWTEKT